LVLRGKPRFAKWTLQLNLPIKLLPLKLNLLVSNVFLQLRSLSGCTGLRFGCFVGRVSAD
jgi:hypothetical protein